MKNASTPINNNETKIPSDQVVGGQKQDLFSNNGLFSGKHILFATHLYAPATGGAESLARNMAEACKLAGNKVTIVTTNAYSTEAFFLCDPRRVNKSRESLNGVDIIRLSATRRFRRLLNFCAGVANRIPYPMRGWAKTLRFGPRNKRFVSRILEQKPDLVVGMPFPMLNTYYAWKAARKLNVPFVLVPCFHLADPTSFSNPFLFRILRRAELVIALTETERNYFIEKLMIKPERVTVIPPGIGPSRHATVRSKKEIRRLMGIEEAHVVLCLGQHGRHKRILEVIKAMEYVWRILPDTALVIAGGVTEYSRILKKAARKTMAKAKNAKIYFYDNFQADQKDDFYRSADLFVSLSEHESFGIVFIEAMQHGLPAIASFRSVAASIVIEYQCGLLVDPGNPSGLAGAVIEILKDPDISLVYGKNARRKVVRKYSSKAVTRRLLKVLGDVLQSAGRPT